jgi:hypothetical protein
MGRSGPGRHTLAKLPAGEAGSRRVRRAGECRAPLCMILFSRSVSTSLIPASELRRAGICSQPASGSPFASGNSGIHLCAADDCSPPDRKAFKGPAVPRRVLLPTTAVTDILKALPRLERRKAPASSGTGAARNREEGRDLPSRANRQAKSPREERIEENARPQASLSKSEAERKGTASSARHQPPPGISPAASAPGNPAVRKWYAARQTAHGAEGNDGRDRSRITPSNRAD